MSTTKDGSDLESLSIEAIEAELAKFEQEERKRLGLPVMLVWATRTSSSVAPFFHENNVWR